MVRMGLVGMGFMGQQHFAIHQSLENVELVAVCDENPSKRSAAISETRLSWTCLPRAAMSA